MPEFNQDDFLNSSPGLRVTIPNPETPSDAPPAKVEVKTAAGITLETPKLSDITGEEELKIMTESLQWTIDDISRQINTSKTWSQKRGLARKLKTYQGFLDFAKGVPVSPKITAEFLQFSSREAEDARHDAFVILTEGRIDMVAASFEEPDYEVFPSPEKMQEEFAAAVKEALVWENATQFSRNPDTPSTK